MILPELFKKPRGPGGLEAVSSSSIDWTSQTPHARTSKDNFSIPPYDGQSINSADNSLKRTAPLHLKAWMPYKFCQLNHDKNK